MHTATTLRATIEQADTELSAIKKQRKETPKHLTYSELPEVDRFLKLATRSKHFLDIIKIIAYRAETAIAHLCTELNATETIYPGTDLRMIFKSVSSKAHPKPCLGQVF